VGMMEEIERGRGRGLPVDALEGRLELLQRRGVLTLDAPSRNQLVELVDELNGAKVDGSEMATSLLGWFTRYARRAEPETGRAVAWAEALVGYLLDVSGEGELKAFEKLTSEIGKRESGSLPAPPT
jgi:hypothetical protein